MLSNSSLCSLLLGLTCFSSFSNSNPEIIRFVTALNSTSIIRNCSGLWLGADCFNDITVLRPSEVKSNYDGLLCWRECEIDELCLGIEWKVSLSIDKS